MKLFTKDIDKKLFKQFEFGSDLENQMVVAKIFNPYGRGTWYIINSDPNDPDYLWCIANFYEVEMGSVLRSELENIRISVGPYKFPLERDLGFTPVNAAELFKNLYEGKTYAKGGKVNFNQGSGRYADGGEFDSKKHTNSGKMYSASSRFKPYETIYFEKPIVGPNGNKLISYQWSYEWAMLPNFEGELKSKRVSDWTQAENSAETGRDIVHKFTVERKDGTIVVVSSETIPSLLGYMDAQQVKNFPSLVSSVKTLAKQRMQLAILKAKETEYNSSRQEIENGEKPKITIAKIDEMPFITKRMIEQGRLDPNEFTYFKMGKETYRQEGNSKIPTKLTIEQLTYQWVSKELEKVNVVKPTGIYDLERRIERQEKKVEALSSSQITYSQGGSLLLAAKGKYIEGEWVVYNPVTDEVLAIKKSALAAKREMQKLWLTGNYEHLGTEPKAEFDKYRSVSTFAKGGQIDNESQLIDFLSQNMVYHGGAQKLTREKLKNDLLYLSTDYNFSAGYSTQRSGASEPQVTSGIILINNPAPADIVEQVASKLGFTTDSYSQAELVEKGEVANELRKMGYDGALRLWDFGFESDFDEALVDIVFDAKRQFYIGTPEQIAQDYFEAKRSGTNPQLIQTIDKLVSGAIQYADGGFISYRNGSFYQKQVITEEESTKWDLRYIIECRRGRSKGFDTNTQIKIEYSEYKTGNNSRFNEINIPDVLIPFVFNSIKTLLQASIKNKNLDKLIVENLIVNGEQVRYRIDIGYGKNNKRGGISIYEIMPDENGNYDQLGNSKYMKLSMLTPQVIEIIHDMLENVQDFIKEGGPGN